MQNQLEQRLKELSVEFENGKKTLAKLDTKRINIQKTMLEISSAIQTLEEEIKKHNA